MGALKNQTAPDPRLHNEDGSHRSTSRSPKGRDIDWFEAQVAVAKFYGVDLDEADRERERVFAWMQEQQRSKA